jgi:general nucleoside transport system permease protein
MMWRLLALIAGAIGILVGGFLLAGVGPVESIATLIRGSLGSGAAIAGTLRETSPLLMLGIAVFLGLRAGLFNIGVEGQFLVGAMAAAVVAIRVPGVPGFLAATLVGMAAGALWALPAAWIRAYRNGHEVITTIMLNNVAIFFTAALVSGPLQDRTQDSPSTAYVAESARMPMLVNNPPIMVNSVLIVGVLIAIALAFWLRRTVPGYELQAVGANSTAATFAGIEPKKVIMKALTSSGAIGGLAGAMQVLAYEGRFYQGFSPGYGFDALGVALLSGGSALAVIPSSLLFGILSRGGIALQIEGVPKGITTVVLGLLIIVAAAIRYRRMRPIA